MAKTHYMIVTQGDLGQAVSFGLTELKRALEENGSTEGEGLVITLEQGGISSPDAFSISRPEPSRLNLAGADERGLMYACLELAEQITLH